MWILVAENHLRSWAIGPFRTRERASGEGLNRFGPLTFGCPVKWRVLEVGK